MKTIIVPTDFSSSADSAMHYGAQLALSAGYTLYLVHVYQIPVSISDIPVMMISGEELKKSADEGLERCREELRNSYEQLDVLTESRLGEVTTELKDVCENLSPLAVVIGSHTESGFERLFFGSTTLSVVRNLSCPVLAITPETKFSPVRNVVFATDLKDLTASAAQKIIAIMQLFQAELHIVHVDVTGSGYDHEKEVKNIAGLLQPLPTAYHEIIDEDVAHGIKTYVEQNKADMIINIHHKHNFWERLFSKTHSENVLMNVTVPVLFLPE